MSASSSLIETNEVRSPLFSCGEGGNDGGGGGGVSLLGMTGVLSALNLTAGREVLEDLLWDMVCDVSVDVCDMRSTSFNMRPLPCSRGV